jgi:signal peptidase I
VTSRLLVKWVAIWIGILLLVLVAYRHFAPSKYRIPQEGMYPSLPAGSTLWVKKGAYKSIDEVRRGDIILFRFMKDDEPHDIIWRVIGLPGDVITVKDSSVVLDGKTLHHRRIREEAEHMIYSERNGDAEYLVAYQKEVKAGRRLPVSLMVPEGEVFVLGDNRDNAADSRYLGTVSFESIIGKRVR